MYDTQDIDDAIATSNPAVISKLFECLIDSGDRNLVRELLTDAMVKIDIQGIINNPDSEFIENVLRGRGWKGYDNLTYLELIGEFEIENETQEILFLADCGQEEEDRLSQLIERASHL